MNTKKPKPIAGYACEPMAGCVYSYTAVNNNEALLLSQPWDYPHIIEMVTRAGDRHEHRLYYALDLHQAVAKAAELLVRMRMQRVRVRLAGIRPASDPETEAFFKELAKYDGIESGVTCRCRP